MTNYIILWICSISRKMTQSPMVVRKTRFIAQLFCKIIQWIYPLVGYFHFENRGYALVSISLVFKAISIEKFYNVFKFILRFQWCHVISLSLNRLTTENPQLCTLLRACLTSISILRSEKFILMYRITMYIRVLVGQVFSHTNIFFTYFIWRILHNAFPRISAGRVHLIWRP